MFAVHWQPIHRGSLGQRTDRTIFAAWGPPIVKIVWDGEKPPYLEDIPPGAKLLWRNYPLSETFHGGLDLGAAHAAGEVFGLEIGPCYGPEGWPQNGSGRDRPLHVTRSAAYVTPEQAAQVYVDNAKVVAAYCATQGFGPERLLFEGPNEYPVWAHGYAGLARLETRRLQLMHQAGLWSVVGNLGVGWPGNTGTDTPPMWGWAGAMIDAFGKGDFLGAHEYNGFGGVRQNWGWWNGRVLKCPYDVPILITESGIDGGVEGPEQAKKGYRSLPGTEDEQVKRCQDEMWEYAGLMAADQRPQATFQYSYDGNRTDWIEFDIRTEAFVRQFLQRIASQGLPEPGGAPVVPPPVEPPIVIDPPARQIVGRVVSQTPNAGTSYVHGHAWQSGVTIRYAWRGNPTLAETVTGPHEGYQGWAPGYYSFPLFVNGMTPAKGEWDIWATDGTRTSARVPFATSGPGNGINQVEIDFALQVVAPEYLPENEPALPVGLLADKVRWWLEESVRQDEAGNAARAQAIRYSLIKLDGGLLYRLENALKAGKPTG